MISIFSQSITCKQKGEQFKESYSKQDYRTYERHVTKLIKKLSERYKPNKEEDHVGYYMNFTNNNANVFSSRFGRFNGCFEYYSDRWCYSRLYTVKEEWKVLQPILKKFCNIKD